MYTGNDSIFRLPLPLSFIPPKPCPASQGSQMDLFPSRLCQPVAGQQRSHLSPPQPAENNLRCACACELVCVCSACVCSGRRTVVNRTMQNPGAGGPKLPITGLGKLMLCARKNPMWFSSTVNELGKDNGSLELGREMRTGLGKRAEAMRNIRLGDGVKEERDYSRCRPEDMDCGLPKHSGIWMGYGGRFFRGLGMRWWQVEPVYENMLWINIQFKGRNGGNVK